jgi:hypothetical protein
MKPKINKIKKSDISHQMFNVNGQMDRGKYKNGVEKTTKKAERLAKRPEVKGLSQQALFSYR